MGIRGPEKNRYRLSQGLTPGYYSEDVRWKQRRELYRKWQTNPGGMKSQAQDLMHQDRVGSVDPFDNEIESQLIEEEDFEGQFKITKSGIYKLVIENPNEKEIKISGVIGPEPDAGKKSLGFISLYVLIIGLIGMAIVPIYAIKNRKRSFS